MDGMMAAIFLIASMTDMTLNDCPTGCLVPEQATSRLSFQVSKLEFDTAIIGSEFYLGYDANISYGPFQPTFGVSATDGGDYWIGAGAKWTTKGIIDSPFFVEASLLPGLYRKGNGPELGGVLQFRSSLGAGYTFDNGSTVSVFYDHRSNADSQIENPGLETIAVRYAIPF